MRRKPILADALRQLVTLQSPKTAAGDEDGFGTIDLTLDANWTDAGDRRAGIKPAKAREFDPNNQQRSDVTHIVTLRYDSLTRTIGPTWRIRFTDDGGRVRTFHVIGVKDPDERHIAIALDCKEAL